MTKSKKPEARWVSEDYPVVIFYAHVSVEQATEITEHDIGDVKEDYGNITAVNHWWVQYRKVGEDDLVNCECDVEPGDTVLWMKESEKRPKGIVTKVTVPEFDGWA